MTISIDTDSHSELQNMSRKKFLDSKIKSLEVAVRRPNRPTFYFLSMLVLRLPLAPEAQRGCVDSVVVGCARHGEHQLGPTWLYSQCACLQRLLHVPPLDVLNVNSLLCFVFSLFLSNLCLLFSLLITLVVVLSYIGSIFVFSCFLQFCYFLPVRLGPV